MLGGTQRRGYPPWNAYNNPRKENSRPYKPNWWDRYGGGTDETGGDTLYARGPKGEGTPGMHMLLPKMKPPARKSKVVGHIREGAGGRQLVPPTLPEGTDIRGHMSVLLLTKSGRVEEISHF